MNEGMWPSVESSPLVQNFVKKISGVGRANVWVQHAGTSELAPHTSG